jgi:multidrug efflux pump subunit AcrA (membrane-fusion protein)
MIPQGRNIRAIAVTASILFIATLGAYAGRLFLSGAGTELQPLTIELHPRDFDLAIPASGELQSSESKAIAVPVVPVNRLRIASVVPDGRHVSKGDVLIEFDPAELDLEALENRSDLEMANQKISKGELSNTVEKTDINKDKKIAELELRKINEFLPRDEQIYSRREIIEGQLDKSYTEKKIVFADVRLELKGKVYLLDEAILMLERQKADTKISQIRKGLASLKLLAPSAGVVAYNDEGYFWGGFSLIPGRVVWVGMNLLNLVNPESMEAKCYVLEKDAGELRPGQPATVTLDPFPGLQYTGKVKQIDNLARPLDRDSPVKYFQTIVSLDKVDSKFMRPGIKVKTRIAAGKLKSALVIPRSAVAKKGDDSVAFVRTEAKRYEPVPVTLGQGDLVQVIVNSGLRAGQVLALNPPDLRPDFSPSGRKKSGQ